MTGYEFTANPGGIKQTADGVDALPGVVEKAADEFKRGVDDVAGLNGIDDDYYDKAQPAFEEQNQAVLGILDSLTQFATGMQSALRKNLGEIERVQGESGEAIQDAQTQANNFDAGGDGKR
jgi:hypothetical protein